MPTEKRPLKVFLCHASADKPKVRELYRYLKRRGIQPWLDAEDLLPGQNWQIEIPKALETSDAIIVCLSRGAVDKEGYVQKEIKFALDKALQMPEGRIFLIPARLEDCDTPRLLSNYQWVDLFDEAGHERLMKSLKIRAAQLQRSNVQTLKVDEAEIRLVPVQEQPKEQVSVPEDRLSPGSEQKREGISVSPVNQPEEEKMVEVVPAAREPKTQPKKQQPVEPFSVEKVQATKPKQKVYTWVFVVMLVAVAIIAVSLIDILSRGTQTSPTHVATGVVPVNTNASISVLSSPTVYSTCDKAEFVTDVTVPDGTRFAPNQTFTKTWRFKNIGTCTWNKNYAIVYESGDTMNNPGIQTFLGDVLPGQVVDISVSLQAPASPGRYKGLWKLRNADGNLFGVIQNENGTFWVDIVVGEVPTP